MSNSPLSRRIMVVMTVAAVALGGIALPAAAKGGPKGRSGHDTAQAATSGAKGKAAAARGRAHKQGPRFVAVGFVESVDTAEVQVRVKGGNKLLRRSPQPVTFTVADDARVKLNGERVALSEIAAGDRVRVMGTKVGDDLVARKVFATRPAEDDADDDATEATEDDSSVSDDSTATP